MNTVADGTFIHYEVIQNTKIELESLAISAKAAADAFSDAVKRVGKNANVDPAVLRAYIKARVSDDPSKARAQAEQLSFLFDHDL